MVTSVGKRSAALNKAMREVILTTVQTVFPQMPEPEGLLSVHAWRDSRYVGRHGGRVATWRGWSANLSHVDLRYRNIYVDVVDNVLPVEERYRLWGDELTEAVMGMDRFIVMFVTALPVDSVGEIRGRGFVPRMLDRVAHGCIVANVAAFLAEPAFEWASRMERLVLLQRVISVRRVSRPEISRAIHTLLYPTVENRPARLVAETREPTDYHIEKELDVTAPFPETLPRSLADMLSELDLLEDLA